VRKRKIKQPKQVGSPLWMTTYADMVTLLLCFFVLLYGISNVDAEKFRGLMSSLRGGFGILDGTVVSDETGIFSSSSNIAVEQLQGIEKQLSEFIEFEGLSGTVYIEHEDRGLVVRFADQVFFDLGKADLKPEAIEILTRLGPLLKDIPNPIRIEGHTDNLPISTARFPSNWELSTHRATSVIRYLVEELGFSPDKLSAAGYGEYRPIADNETPAGRALNRRVDIVIISMDHWAEEPKSEME
jgi:chemotaxis protein MotB